jgi:two-component system nitrate/nitrite response regulator NarL
MRGLLICDDNPNIRYLLRAFVESRTPFNVCGEAAHGVEAIEKAKKLQPDFILLDLCMPIMTGAEAAVILKGVAPRMKIILFSMHVDDVPIHWRPPLALTLRCRSLTGSQSWPTNYRLC